MRTLELLRTAARRHGVFVLASAGLLALFQMLIAAAVASVDIGGAIQTMLQGLPEMLRTVLETTVFGGLSVRGLLGFGWSHPVALAAGAAVAIALGSHAIAGACEDGTLELVLTQPVSRRAYLAAQTGFALVALGAVSACGVGGSALGPALFHLPRVGASTMLRLAVDYALLQCAWYAVALALSSVGREGARVAGVAFLVALASYVAEVIGRLWQAASWVRPWSLDHYFPAQEILAAGASIARPAATLAAVTVAGLAFATWRFVRRDLP